ncbi:hypothetical protein L0Y46_03475 [bacterium]|nr:hypothetical protein [bacterium]
MRAPLFAGAFLLASLAVHAAVPADPPNFEKPDIRAECTPPQMTLEIFDKKSRDFNALVVFYLNGEPFSVTTVVRRWIGLYSSRHTYLKEKNIWMRYDAQNDNEKKRLKQKIALLYESAGVSSENMRSCFFNLFL